MDDIYELYLFDDKLRSLFLRNILKIEKHVKSLISYSFCEIYGEAQEQYFDVENYNCAAVRKEDIERLTSIPLWVMMKALTLGTVSKMYTFLPQRIQHNVSKEFEYVHESMLVQMLDILARVRNVCAHNERLYDYRYRKGTIDNTFVHEALQISKKNEHYVKGKNDLFAVVVVLKYLLDAADFSAFVLELKQVIEDLANATRILQTSQMYKYMGFPINWEEIEICRKNK